jgi:hypothetical protein
VSALRVSKAEVRRWIRETRRELREVERRLNENEPVGQAAIDMAGTAGEVEVIAQRYDSAREAAA